MTQSILCILIYSALYEVDLISDLEKEIKCFQRSFTLSMDLIIFIFHALQPAENCFGVWQKLESESS